MGISTLITQLSIVAMTTDLNNLISRYGQASEYGADIPLAVSGIVIKISQLSSSIVMGLATGIQPIIGYNYGNGQYHRVKKTYWTAITLSTAIMVCVWVFLRLFPEQVIGLFGDESDLYVSFAVRCMNIMLLTLPVFGIYTVTGILFQSVGKPVIAMFISLTKNVLYYIPISIVMAAALGLNGILWSTPVADMLACLTALSAIAICWKKMFKEETAG